jgi:hypothetical protein
MRLCFCCSNNKNKINSIHISIINDFSLKNLLNIYFCSDCNFYFSDSDNNQSDYDNYYKLFSKYKTNITYFDKDERCNQYLKKELNNKNIKTILDYGSGNGILKDLLSNDFDVDKFDIGMKENNNQYDCLILSHVLEHIYNLNNFLLKISNNIKTDGLLYIEVPNAEFYDKLNCITPLQEINIEHINFFSKFSLNKLLLKHGYCALSLIDDYFKIKENDYYIIRGIFKKNEPNNSFKNYINNGYEIISSYNFSYLNNYDEIYIYGCGQFLFKILKNIQEFTKVINIIDDNLCYYDKTINNINIINFDKYKEISKPGDFILLTTLIYDDIIKTKIKTFNNDKLIVKSIKELN